MNYWEWIARSSNILGILTVLFSGYAAYLLWRQNQRFRALARELQQSIDIRQRIEDYKGVQTVKPVALAVSLLPIVPSIKDIELHSEGFTEVHLFLAGPVAAGVIIGAMLNNWVPVKIYHKPTPSPADVYEYWMPLFKI